MNFHKELAGALYLGKNNVASSPSARTPNATIA